MSASAVISPPRYTNCSVWAYLRPAAPVSKSSCAWCGRRVIIVSALINAMVNPYIPHTPTTSVTMLARLAGDLDTMVALSSYSMLHVVNVRGVSSSSLPTKRVERMVTRSALTWGSAWSRLSSAVLRTAVKKILNSIDARTHPWRRRWPTSNHSDTLPPSSRTHARISSWNWRTISTITGGIPNRVKRERSTKSYDFWRSTKQVYNGTLPFLPNSCNRGTMNVMSIVDCLVGIRIVTPRCVLGVKQCYCPYEALDENTASSLLCLPYNHRFVTERTALSTLALGCSWYLTGRR